MKHGVDVIVFVEDMAASGGYWIACAGSQIYSCRSLFEVNVFVFKRKKNLKGECGCDTS